MSVTFQESAFQSFIGSIEGIRTSWNGINGLIYTLDNYHPIPSRKELLFNILNGFEISSVLELGCNVGNNLRDLDNGQRQLVGLDILSCAVAGRGFPAILGNVESLPVANKSFDLVLMSCVLCHIPIERLGAVLSEAFRVSNRYVLLIDYHSDNNDEMMWRWKGGCWSRNFKQAALDTVPGSKMIEYGRIPNWLISPDPRVEYGLFEV